MSDNPIKLWPGPCEDGRETYFTLGADIPDEWERRWGVEEWRAPSAGVSSGRWYQCRPPVDPPEPRYLHKVGDGESYVVTWAEMRGRTDWAEWEYLSPEFGRGRIWTSLRHVSDRPNDYPLRVRRKQP